MKIYKFEEKLPVLGSNILVFHENGKLVGICEFDLLTRKSVLSENDSHFCSQLFYSDDPEEDREYDIRSTDFWCYPSSIKLPKKKEI